MHMDTDNLISAQEAATTLGVSRQRIYTLVKAGKLRGTFNGGPLRIPLEDVEQRKAETTDGGFLEPSVKGYLSRSEAAVQLGVSETTLNTWIYPDKQNGAVKLRSELIGHRRLIPVDAVERLAASR